MAELAYKFTGAGHEMPEEKRKYTEPDKRLSQIFENWLKEQKNEPDIWDWRPVKPLEDMEVTVAEAHALLLKYRDHPELFKAGIFISAMYNKAPDKVIVYDLELPIQGLAHRLNGKTFINNGTTGHCMGQEAKGNVINNGTTGWRMGNYAKGNIINNGTTERSLGQRARGNVINNGTTDQRMGEDATGYIINNGKADCSDTLSAPKLKQYLDNLKAQLTNPNMEEVLKVLEDLTPEKLSKEIGSRIRYIDHIRKFLGLERGIQ